jgi:hypothetical protein
MLLDDLAANRPFLCATPVDDAHCQIAVVYDGPGKAARGIARGTLEGPAGVSFIAITIGTSKRGGTAIEDGAGMILNAEDAQQLREALGAGEIYHLEDADPGRMKLRVEPP